MTKITRLGIIGIGRCGTYYLRTFNELKNAEIKWIAATRQSTMEDALRIVQPDNVPKKTTDYQHILNDPEIDAVAIATPGSTHFKIVKEALLAGKHVLVEKPLAFSSHEAEELVHLAEQQKKTLMVGHLHLHNPPIQKLKEDIQKGMFGNIKYMRSLGAGSGPIRTDMSAVWDFFPHDVSIALYLLDKFPVSVCAHGASYTQEGIEDVATINMFFDDNTFVTATCSWLDPLKKREVIVVGEKLSAVFDDYASPEKLKYIQHVPSTDARRGMQQDTEVHIPFVQKALPLTEELKHFLECVETGAMPLTNGYNAIKVTRVLEAAHESIKRGGIRIAVPTEPLMR